MLLTVAIVCHFYLFFQIIQELSRCDITHTKVHEVDIVIAIKACLVLLLALLIVFLPVPT